MIETVQCDAANALIPFGGTLHDQKFSKYMRRLYVVFIVMLYILYRLFKEDNVWCAAKNRIDVTNA